MHPYTETFYRDNEEGASRSAREIIPIIMELIFPECVIDVGCGIGIWLAAFKEMGVDEVWGVDGHYVDKRMLQISQERFLAHDLKTPLNLDRDFDLVLSLEVAEHLSGECAEIFVDSLTKQGPVILFSAAIPFQSGTDHINVRWPDYWAELFQSRGYVVIDCIRKRVWNNDNVESWYAQNMLVFAKRNHIEENSLLKNEFESTNIAQLSIVHPRHYLSELANLSFSSDPKNMPLNKVLSALPHLITKAVKRRLRL